MSYYDTDEDIDVHVRHRGHSPAPVRYVQSPPRRFYDQPAFLVPQDRTTVVARSRSRSRDRRRESPPSNFTPQPVIINNRIYNDNSSDEDDDRRYRQVAMRPRSRSRERTSMMTREDWEAEQARRDLDAMRLNASRDKDERRWQREFRDTAELTRAKRELDEIKAREARSEDEKRIKKELDLKRLREQQEEQEQKELREKEAKLAVEKYKQEELERIAKEEKKKEAAEKEYKRRLQEDLINSGLDERAIAAIINKGKVGDEQQVSTTPNGRPTYMRMARRHLSIETLRTFRVEFDYDQDPDYLLIKRWVPEWEQDQFWTHTRYIREKRGSGKLMVEEKRRKSKEPEFEWVRKKHDRKRSKSPGVLMYLAGGRPS